jgi:hypothetical protein
VLLRTLDGSPAPSTLINFDTDTNGAAIATGTSVNSTYTSWGVTFQFVPCPLGTLLCLGGGPNVYAVNGATFAYSKPNVVGTISNTLAIQQQWGSVQANFATSPSSVSIEVLQTCIGQDGGCVDTPASEAAFLTAFNSSGVALATAQADSANTTSYQKLTVSASGIAYVVFSVPYDSINSGTLQLEGTFDNLSW